MRKYSLKLSLSLAGVLLLGGASLLSSPLDYLKSLNLAPKTASLGKPQEVEASLRDKRSFLWYICMERRNL